MRVMRSSAVVRRAPTCQHTAACHGFWSGINKPVGRPNPRACSTSGQGAPQQSSSSGGTPQQEEGLERILFFESGNAVSLTSRRRAELWPELHFSQKEAVFTQLAALQANNTPYVDHGVEVLYRFASFDPFNPRTLFFGRVFDLGQFERFRRIMHTPPYAPLLGHESSDLISALEVSEHVWVARVSVRPAAQGDAPVEDAVYEFTMVQRVGGVHDGYWFTQSLIADGNDWNFMKAPRPGQAI